MTRDFEPFNLHFQEIFFVSDFMIKVLKHIRNLSISIFRRFSLFRRQRRLKSLRSRDLSISIFRRFSLFRNVKRTYTSEYFERELSISIFRRFSLFHDDLVDIQFTDKTTFNLHFQEIFFVSTTSWFTLNVQR